jgi:hypothetical protein
MDSVTLLSLLPSWSLPPFFPVYVLIVLLVIPHSVKLPPSTRLPVVLEKMLTGT